MFDLKGHHFNKCESLMGIYLPAYITYFIYILKAGLLLHTAASQEINQHYNEETMPETCHISR